MIWRRTVVAERDKRDTGPAHQKGAESRLSALRFWGRRIVVELDEGASFSSHSSMAQDLASAPDKNLAEVEIQGDGFGLHWGKLDVDFTVGGLAAVIFGTAQYMATQAGWAKSEAKAAAARANGASGGRPRKTTG